MKMKVIYLIILLFYFSDIIHITAFDFEPASNMIYQKVLKSNPQRSKKKMQYLTDGDLNNYWAGKKKKSVIEINFSQKTTANAIYFKTLPGTTFKSIKVKKLLKGTTKIVFSKKNVTPSNSGWIVLDGFSTASKKFNVIFSTSGIAPQIFEIEMYSIYTDVFPGVPINEGNNNADNIFRAFTLDPSNPDFIYIGTESNGLFKSVDAGENWIWYRKGFGLNEANQNDSSNYYDEIWDMAVDPNDSQILYAATLDSPGPAEGNYPSASAGLYKSYNGGETWVRKMNGLDNSRIESVVHHPSEENTVYIGVGGGTPSFTGTDVDGQIFNGGVFVSTDGGAVWNEIEFATGPVEKNGFKLLKSVHTNAGVQLFTTGIVGDEYNNGSSNWAYASKSLGMMTTILGSGTWTSINPSDGWAPNFDISQSDPNIIYVNEPENYIIKKSIDGGNSYTSVVSSPAAGPLAIDPTDSNRIFFTSNASVIYRSTDGFASFPEGPLLNFPTTVNEIVIHPTNPSIIYVIGEDYTVYRSIDGGDTFSEFVNLRQLIQ